MLLQTAQLSRFLSTNAVGCDCLIANVDKVQVFVDEVEGKERQCCSMKQDTSEADQGIPKSQLR